MEVIHSHPPPGERLRPVERVRSTLITAGIANLRALGFLDEWSRGVDAEARDELLTSIAGTWLPVELAFKYYRGCDALNLTHEQGVSIGRSFAARVSGTVLHAVKHVASGIGVTPWTYA